MRWKSDDNSYDQGLPSAAGVVETVLAIVIVSWVSIHFQSLTPLAFWSAFGWTLMLRSELSDRIAYKVFAPFFEMWCEAYSLTEETTALFEGENPYSQLWVTCRTVFSCAISLLLVIGLPFCCIAIKTIAVVVSLVIAPIPTLSGLPSNWKRAMMSLDICRPLEFIPGFLKYNEKHKLFVSERMSLPGEEPEEIIDMRISSWLPHCAPNTKSLIISLAFLVGVPAILLGTPAGEWTWTLVGWILHWLRGQFVSGGWHVLIGIWLSLGALAAALFLVGLYVQSAQGAIAYAIRGPGRFLLYVPALAYRVGLKTTAIIYYPLFLYKERWIGPNDDVNVSMNVIWRNSVLSFFFVVPLFLAILLKAVLLMKANVLIEAFDSNRVARFFGLFVVPKSLPWWQIASAANAALTILVAGAAHSLWSKSVSKATGLGVSVLPRTAPSLFVRTMFNTSAVLAGLLVMYALACNAIVVWKHRDQLPEILADVRKIQVDPIVP